MKFLKTLVLVALLCSFTISSGILDNTLSHLKVYENENFPEKTFIHTDKPYYTTGETIWLKSYLVNGIDHTIIKKSKVLYVELINPNDSIVFKEKFFVPSLDFGVAGNIDISDNWESGDYQLRAYTNYMRNSDSKYFFRKLITIEKLKEISKDKVDTEVNIASVSDSLIGLESVDIDYDITKQEGLSIKFYPEGGTIVANENNLFGIKAEGKKGNGIKIQGIITEKWSDEILYSFKTFDFGLGKVSLNLKPNIHYVAKVSINGKVFSYDLPVATNTAVNLQVKKDNSNITLSVNSNNIDIDNYFIIGHTRGKVFYSKEIKGISKDKYSVQLMTGDLENGVSHFTLFNKEGRPECERLIFIDNTINSPKTEIKLNKDQFEKREQINVAINSFIAEKEVQNANVSLAVTRKDIVPLSYQEHIKSWLLLNSDLKGEISNAMFFFDEKKPKKMREFLLESLMLTHGWRRFNWRNTTNHLVENTRYEAEKGIYIRGRVWSKNSKVAAPSIATKLVFMGSEVYSEAQNTGRDGRFSYGPYTILDTVDAILEARIPNIKNERQSKNLFISFDDDEISSPNIDSISTVKKTYAVSSFFEDYKREQEYINQINFSFDKVNKLDEVLIIKERDLQNEKFQKRVEEFFDYSFPTYRIPIDPLDALTNNSTFELLTSTPRIKFQAVWLDGNLIWNEQMDPVILMERLSAIPASSIAFIDWLRGADVGTLSGARGYSSVVALYTHKDDYQTNIPKPGIKEFFTSPFYKAKEFYSPNYDKDPEELIMPDYRTTLYWNPNINIGIDKKHHEVFYANDQPGIYQIEVQGITGDGKLIYATEEFEIIE